MQELHSLEDALVDIEQRTKNATRSIKRVASALAAAQKAGTHGDLPGLRRALKEATDTLKVAQVDIDNMSSAWRWDDEMEQDYLRGGRFIGELKREAAAARLNLQEDEGQLMCYPSILKIDAARRVMLIDKRPYKFLRPTVLVAHLREVQKRPPRFKAAAFIESLYTAWDYARHFKSGSHGLSSGVGVDKVYAVLTIAPGSSKEYTKQEFGRDLYLLEASDVRATRKGSRVSFHRATGTKATSGVISVVGEDDRKVIYSSIAFSEGV
ncbi:MAG: hypothetical protein EXS64_07835 [Candidatus Latescibacteria bacterium]|nr:hypothetical protein [Candidatus Latescibacterota bacterium]